MALKLRRAEERFIPQSTRAASFKRLLGGGPLFNCFGSPLSYRHENQSQKPHSDYDEPQRVKKENAT